MKPPFAISHLQRDAGEPLRQSAIHWQTRLQALGWTVSLLAAALGVSRSHLSRVIHNPRRSLQWECCLAGLPPLNAAWRRQLQVGRKAAPPARAANLTLAPYLPGSVFRVRDGHDSPLMPEGSRGVCLAVRTQHGQDAYLLRFEGGGEDWFDLASLHQLLAETGETADITNL